MWLTHSLLQIKEGDTVQTGQVVAVISEGAGAFLARVAHSPLQMLLALGHVLSLLRDPSFGETSHIGTT